MRLEPRAPNNSQRTYMYFLAVLNLSAAGIKLEIWKSFALTRLCNFQLFALYSFMQFFMYVYTVS